MSTLTLRVPALAYDSVIAELRQIAVRVDHEKGTAKDITEEYTDLEARLRHMQATEIQYLELLKRAGTIEEILKVQQRLDEVQGEIERAKGRMQLLERNSDMATITVSLMPIIQDLRGTLLEWEPVRAVQESWQASLSMLQALTIMSIRVIVFAWWLIPLLVVAAWYSRRKRLSARAKNIAAS